MLHFRSGLLSFCLLALACARPTVAEPADPEAPFVVVLGIAQDAGYPQAGCTLSCCANVWDNPSLRKMAASIAIVDPKSRQAWMVDATPDFKYQLHHLQSLFPDTPLVLSGILLTHAHIGHYTGLMHLGREVMGAAEVPVFSMPRMRAFLRENGPWNQLVSLRNIALQPIAADSTYQLNERLRITPIAVPHRDELSETVGFEIAGPTRRLLYIPDIDKWDRWDQPITTWIKKTDYALLDGTFFDSEELPGRNMSEIPHPFIVESMRTFEALPATEKDKVHFVHLNHTNPALLQNSPQRADVLQAGFHVAEQNIRWQL